MKLKPLNRHCSDLAKIIYNSTRADELLNTAEWLQIASGIESVSYDSAKFDQTIGWCSAADEYLSAQEQIRAHYVLQLTVFSFIWSATEALIDEAVIKGKGEGKVQSAIRFLRENYTDQHCPPPSKKLLACFRERMESSLGFDQILNRYSTFRPSDGPGLGLHVIYKLRNLVAHGVKIFPVPDSENQAPRPTLLIPELCSRIALLSMQAIMKCVYRHHADVMELIYCGIDDIGSCFKADEDGQYRIYDILSVVQFESQSAEGTIFDTKSC